MPENEALERRLFAAFAEAGHELHLVGGCVRDRLLGLPVGDLDFATGARPAETAALLDCMGLTVYTIGAAYGTVSAVVPSPGSGRVEITTYRSEVYRKGSRKPVVTFGDNLEDDLVRRDFTLNAIAIDAAGGVVDPCGGLGDLRAGVLRTPLDPLVTMREDPLRMLRAARFAGRFGFALAVGLPEAIRSCSADMAIVAVERQLMELDGLLGLQDGFCAARAVRVIDECGLLGQVLPELEPLRGLNGTPSPKWHDLSPWDHTLMVLRHAPPILVVRWAALLHDCGKPATAAKGADGFDRYPGHEAAGARIAIDLALRLKFPRRRREAVAGLVRMHMRPALYDGGWGESAVRRLTSDAGDSMPDLLALARADARSLSPGASAEKLALLDDLEQRAGGIAQRMSGRFLPQDLGDLLRAEMYPGKADAPKIGDAILRLTDLIADGLLPAGRDARFYADWLTRKNGRGQSSKT